MPTIRTHVALILDKSGSMNDIKESSLNTFNEQIQTLKSESSSPDAVAKKLLAGGSTATGIETYVTIVTFNNNVDFDMFNEDIGKLEEFPKDQYVPNNGTALYDAVGLTIERFQNEILGLEDPDTSVLFIIVTDGQENSSRKFAGEEGRKRLKSLVEDLQAGNKWTFTFMGAEKVLETAVDGLGIYRGNVKSFTASAVGMSVASAAMGSSTRSYMSARTLGKTAVSNFYAPEENEEEKNKTTKIKKPVNKV